MPQTGKSPNIPEWAAVVRIPLGADISRSTFWVPTHSRFSRLRYCLLGVARPPDRPNPERPPDGTPRSASAGAPGRATDGTPNGFQKAPQTAKSPTTRGGPDGAQPMRIDSGGRPLLGRARGTRNILYHEAKLSRETTRGYACACLRLREPTDRQCARLQIFWNFDSERQQAKTLDFRI